MHIARKYAFLLTFRPVCLISLLPPRKVKDFAEIIFDKFYQDAHMVTLYGTEHFKANEQIVAQVKLKFNLKQVEVRLEKEHKVEGRRCIN